MNILNRETPEYLAYQKSADLIRAFVEEYKPRIQDLPGNQSWDSDVWDVDGVVEFNKSADESWNLRFNKLHKIKGKKNLEPMFYPFIDFAKAYMMRLITLDTSGPVIGQEKLLLCQIEAVLANHHFGDMNPISRITTSIAEEISDFITNRHGKGTFTDTGLNVRLENFLWFISEKKFVPAPIDWKWMGSRATRNSDSTRPEAKKQREEHIPSKEAMNALMHIYCVTEDPVHVLITSACAILVGMPGRIHELLTIPANCEVETERNGKRIYGLRWWPSKNGNAMVKECLPETHPFAPVYKEAIARIRKLTDPARQVAKWYEEHPNQLYLEPELEHLRSKEYVSGRELQQILGYGNFYAALNWARDNNVRNKYSVRPQDKTERSFGLVPRAEFLLNFERTYGRAFTISMDSAELINAKILTHEQIMASPSRPWKDNRGYLAYLRREGITLQKARDDEFSFSDIEAVVLRSLPKGFPYLHRKHNLKYSEALFTFFPLRPNSGERAFNKVMVTSFKFQAVNQALGLPSRGECSASMFSTHGFTEQDGSPITVNTHDFRHFHNTRALLAGVRNDWINHISGRKSPHHLDSYDHRSMEEKANRLDSLRMDGELYGEIQVFKPNTPVTPEEIETMVDAGGKHHTYLVTEFGVCKNFFAIRPCPAFRDCLNCREHVCIKGLPAKTENIRRALQLAEHLYKECFEAGQRGDKGRARWAEQTHLPVLLRLRKQMAILDDPAFPIGTQISLASTEAVETPIEKALHQRILYDKTQGLDTNELQGMLLKLRSEGPQSNESIG